MAWAASRSAGLRKIVPSTSNDTRDQEELDVRSPGFEGIAEGRSTWNPSAPARREVNKELTTGLGTRILDFVIGRRLTLVRWELRTSSASAARRLRCMK